VTPDKIIPLLLSIIIAGLGWWVNAQEKKISDLDAELTEAGKQIQAQKLDVVNDINEIKTAQALGSQTQKQILEAIQEMREELRVAR
jgi:hypothetical protein